MLRTVLMALAGAGLRGKVKQLKRAMVFYTVAGVAFVFAILFLLVAGFIFFAERHGALVTALGFGGAFLLIAIVTMAIYGLGGRSVTSRRKVEEERAEQMRAIATAAAIGAAPAIIRSTGIVGAIVLPLAAAAAYAIYRENTRPPRPPGHEEL